MADEEDDASEPLELPPVDAPDDEAPLKLEVAGQGPGFAASLKASVPRGDPIGPVVEMVLWVLAAAAWAGLSGALLRQVLNAPPWLTLSVAILPALVILGIGIVHVWLRLRKGRGT
ncbi:hypothetical protein [Kineococcus terrestris]|uniref:hypothetical protein n=1 Tax=Kineococcus terrestris TaxID=2044856 RepID=UPI0034DAEC7C